jgi:hypothetical protein
MEDHDRREQADEPGAWAIANGPTGEEWDSVVTRCYYAAQHAAEPPVDGWHYSMNTCRAVQLLPYSDESTYIPSALCIAPTPLAGARVNVGSHVLTVRHSKYSFTFHNSTPTP